MSVDICMNLSLADWLKNLESRHPVEIDLGLHRCGKVYRRLGSPVPAPRVITVAGTNGKGSVVAYLSAMLSAMGYRCGTYTSPHLMVFNERVRIDGSLVSDRQLTDAFVKTENARDKVSLTYFEFTTLAAFQLMNESELDFAILEVGLGGRLDTVNLADPDCAVITTIGLDHQNFLGNDREAIGSEKAGIMRSNKPVVCGDRDPPVSLINAAQSLDADLLVLGEDFDWKTSKSGLELNVREKIFNVSLPALPGRHQYDNLATAVAAIQQIIKTGLASDNNWTTAPETVEVAGRLMKIETDRRLILDVGHNPLAAKVIKEYLNGLQFTRLFCVLGMLKDKDTAEIVGLLDPVTDKWVCSGLTGARGQSAIELADKVRRTLPDSEVVEGGTVGEALDVAMGEAQDDDLILVFGSFETISAAMSKLRDLHCC